MSSDSSPTSAENSAFIKIVNLSKSFEEGGRRRAVLEGVNASFARGEFVAILGKSGSGKSTLLNLISGIDDADRGEIWLGGKNLTAMDERQRTLFRRSNIGFIFQFFNLIPTLTVWENVILPVELNAGKNSAGGKNHAGGKSHAGGRNIAGGKNGAGAERARELLQAVGLSDRAEAFPDRLSGGEQQRVSIARALVNDPLLVLADEPTGNLDEETGRRVMALLDRLTRQAGKNLLLVTHSREAAAYADRVLTLRNGTLS